MRSIWSALIIVGFFANLPAAMAGKVNIEGLDKAALVQLLFKRAKVIGMGWLAGGPKEITYAEAQTHVGKLIDYLHGKPMKIYMRKDDTELETKDYNDYNGVNAAEEVIEALRMGAADSIPARRADRADLFVPAAVDLQLLKNGTSEALPTILTTFTTLKNLFYSDPITVLELTMKCRNKNHQFFKDTLEVLKNYSLVEVDGSISTAVQNIVLSSIVGDGLDLKLTSPFADQP